MFKSQQHLLLPYLTRPNKEEGSLKEIFLELSAKKKEELGNSSFLSAQLVGLLDRPCASKIDNSELQKKGVLGHCPWDGTGCRRLLTLGHKHFWFLKSKEKDSGCTCVSESRPRQEAWSGTSGTQYHGGQQGLEVGDVCSTATIKKMLALKQQGQKHWGK